MSSVTLGPGAAIPLRYANRHGLITGPTGSGKSVTVMRLVEGLSAAGVPVFLADVKGDLSALARSRPSRLLDVYGEAGDPLRATVAALGPDLLARALDLSDAQAGSLELAFHVAASRGMRLDSVGDLRAVLGTMLRERERLSATLGQVSPASVGVVQRALLRLDSRFLAAPAFDVRELVAVPGRVSILSAERLIQSGRLYSALLLYLLTELETALPEIGDAAAPRLAFVFDEAHLLFRDVPPALLARLERTARLIRSKGVGIYFASQRESDIPETIREQCAHRLAHSRELGPGRAVVATLGQDGRPRPVITAPIALPAARLGALRPEERPAPVSPRPRDNVVTGQGGDVAASIGAAVTGLGVVGLALYGLLSAFGLTGSAIAAVAVGAGLALKR